MTKEKNINVPVKPWYRCVEIMNENNGKVRLMVRLVCPTCHYRLELTAPRCPECGQLFRL